MYRYFLYHPDLRQPVQLKHTPVGWDGLNKQLSRDLKMHGVMFNYTPELKFIKDGKAIIHSLIEAYGPQVEIIIFIDELNRVTRKYERDYTGKLKLMGARVSKLYFQCHIENTGFVQKFKNRYDQKVDVQSLVNKDFKAIPAFGTESETIAMHSRKIVRKLTSETRIETGAYTVPVGDPETGSLFFMFGLEPTNDEVLDRFDYGTHVSTIDPFTTGKHIFKMKEAGTFVINIPVRCELESDETPLPGFEHDWTAKVYFKYGRPGNYTTVELATDTDDIEQKLTLSFTYNATLTLQAGDELHFYGELFGEGFLAGNSTITLYPYIGPGPLFQKTGVNITADTTYPSTNVTSYLAHEVITRICQSIIGDNDPVRSNYYGRTDSDPVTYAADGAGSLRAFMSGFWLRGFPKADKSMHISCKEIVEALQMIDGIGVGIEVIDGKEYVVVDSLDHFYQSKELMKLNFVKDLEKEYSEQHYYSDMKIGYKKWSVTGGAVNQLDEYNTTRDLSFPIDQTKNTLSLVAPVIAGGYPLEATRRDAYVKSNTKDNEFDNDVFVVQLKRDGGNFVPAKNEDFTTLTGVISPETIYNADLSLSRCIRRNGSLIRSFLEKHKDKSVKVDYIEGNKGMVSQRTGESAAITEGADIPITQLSKSLWLPEVYRFKSVLSREQINEMNLSPYGYVSFSDTDKNHKKCFILEARRDANTKLVHFVGLRANL